MTKTVSKVLSEFAPSLKSIAKMLLMSRKVNIAKAGLAGKRIIIMANGPSLKKEIEQNFEILAKGPSMAVNFAANAPEFDKLRPRYYMLLDPYFFQPSDNEALASLWANLAKVNWPMTLIIPAKEKSSLSADVRSNGCISLATINPVGVEGWHWLENWAYGHAAGMPRPRNVLIAAIMAAMQMGYREIELVGADHSWMQSIWVDDDNHVITVQPHFYKENEKEQKRVDAAYRGLPLHDVVLSFYLAFRGYHRIQRYASKAGVKIYNCTPGSYIDAFPRRPLSRD